MASDLERFRDHARRMAAGELTDVDIGGGRRARKVRSSPEDRDEWKRLADEADRFLHSQDQDDG